MTHRCRKLRAGLPYGVKCWQGKAAMSIYSPRFSHPNTPVESFYQNFIPPAFHATRY